MAGFKKYVRKGVALDLNEVISVDITLQLGATAETVEVTGAPPVVDTTSTQLGAVVNERASTQLPLNQRDVYQLLQLQPGVQSQLGNDTVLRLRQSGRRHRQRWPRPLQQLFRERRRRQRSLRQLAGDRAFARFDRRISRHQQLVRRRIRPQLGRGRQRRHQVRHQRLSTAASTNFSATTCSTRIHSPFSPAPKPEFRQNQFGGTIGGPIAKTRPSSLARMKDAASCRAFCRSRSMCRRQPKSTMATSLLLA